MMLPKAPPKAKASIPTKIKANKSTKITHKLIMARVIFPVLIPKDSKDIPLIFNNHNLRILIL